MAIRMYHDSEATEEVSDTNPDEIKTTVSYENDYEQTETFYLLTDDEDLTYENVSIEKTGTSSDKTVYVDYALDLSDFDNINEGEQESLDLDDGDYTSTLTIHRRVTVLDITDAFNTVDEIYHRVKRDEYAK